jgi:type 1 glutamine amidotransferase
MKYTTRFISVFLLSSLITFSQAPPAPAPPSATPAATPGGRGRGGRGRGPVDPFAGQKRIRALVISGGCCHDYRGQDKILMDLMANELPVDWTILYEGGTGGDVKVQLYEKPNWAVGYDLVIHNECYANVNDEKLIGQIVAAHKAGVPSMVFHCSLHSYRPATVDGWREFMGVQSHRHTMAHNIAVKLSEAASPITKGMPAEWSTPTDELYVIEKTWPGVTTLATAVSPEEGHAVYPVIWTNDYYGTRVFGTSLGHGETWNDPVFREMTVRAFKWTLKRE